jgi:hypothetical protein
MWMIQKFKSSIVGHFWLLFHKLGEILLNILVALLPSGMFTQAFSFRAEGELLRRQGLPEWVHLLPCRISRKRRLLRRV